MKPEDQNIAIATKLGWRINNGMWHHPDGTPIGFIPEFTRDLNAIHEAEEVLDYDQQEYFLLFIGAYKHESDAPWDTCHATAAQRCEAFLKTLSLWKETES